MSTKMFCFNLQRVKDLIGINYLIPNKWMRVFIGEKICRESLPTQILCKSIVFMLTGYESDQMNNVCRILLLRIFRTALCLLLRHRSLSLQTLLPVILGHTPAGCSTDQLIHFGQLVKSGHFRKFDYGLIGNLLKYHRFTPPDYNLENVQIPVSVYYSQNDWLANVKDIHKLLQTLPNVVKSYLIPHKQFNHIDFLWGIDAPILLYHELLQTMKASHS